MTPYETAPFVIPAGQNRKLANKVDSFAILSATFVNDVSISFNGGSFFNLPFGVTLDFGESVELWVQNTNASANTITIGGGSAKIHDNRIAATGAVVAVSSTDGALVSIGAMADAAATTDAGTFSLLAFIKRLCAKFPAALGSAVSALCFPVVIASDQAAVAVKGNAATGSAVTGNPILIGGQDGANARSLLTDTSGRAINVGAAAVGAAVAGNPVLVGGTDGTNARYILLDASGRPQENIAQIAGVAPDMNAGAASANTLRVALATNSSANVAQINGVAPLMGNGVTGTGSPRVTIASDNTANSNPWLDTLVASAAQGAATTHHAISAASTNATSVKGSGGSINTLVVSNINAAARYFKLYNKATAPTVGTDTPVLTLLIPANSNAFVDCGPYGIRLGTGIAYALTTGITVADTGAVAASEHSVHVTYT